MGNQVATFSGSTDPLLRVSQSKIAKAIAQMDPAGGLTFGAANIDSINNGGGTILGVKTISAVATLDGTATLIACDATAAAFALTLPAAVASAGFVYLIVKADAVAHSVTITGNASENIVSDGAVGNTYALTAKGKQVLIWCDGTQWYAH